MSNTQDTPDNTPKTVAPLSMKELKDLINNNFSTETIIKVIDKRFTDEEQEGMTGSDATDIVIQLYRQTQEAPVKGGNFPVKIG